MLSLSIVTALLYSHLVSKEYCGDKSRKYKEIRPILNLIASSGKGVCRLFGKGLAGILLKVAYIQFFEHPEDW